MKTICLFIFTTTFSQTMTKHFLLTLENENSNKLQNKSVAIEQDKKVEKVSNTKDSDEEDLDTKEMTKGVKSKPPRKDQTADNKKGNDYSVAIDYSSLHLPRPKQSSKMMKTNGRTKGNDYSGGAFYSARSFRGGNTPMRYEGGTRWECRYKKSTR